MNFIPKSIFAILLIGTSYFGFSQESDAIPNYGPTFEVLNLDFETDKSTELKIVFDITAKSKDPNDINRYIESAARFINMNVKHGVTPKNIKVALVLHSAAVNDVLLDEDYATKNSEATNGNPNTKLVSELADFGVNVIVCGQTAAAANILKSQMLPEVKMALSAMNALVQLQNEGYQLINF